jgi:hypothetical protein
VGEVVGDAVQEPDGLRAHVGEEGRQPPDDHDPLAEVPGEGRREEEDEGGADRFSARSGVEFMSLFRFVFTYFTYFTYLQLYHGQM